MKKDVKKQLAADYMEQERVMGVYQIVNQTTGRIFVGSSSNMSGAWSRARFELDMGMHKCKPLQNDWKKQGLDAFTFEIVDRLKLEEKLRFDYKDVFSLQQEGQAAQQIRQYRKDTQKLEQVWLEKLQEQGIDIYNE
ncbi:GIY-YIG nuclease family protein [Paenibacillus radicis (ex Gao et al. 2016)]|uniref:Nuclease n=1 Tax=Paenibacillus radicis (ex Gao et al. 2016) TaxID=1737354 RepID=A0A917GZ92_9BACL|nr:GIY-YIG nuclease family protein [Paenibacillus radicis (ex Gao et al. 2016)]GGG62869.1 nuclease [Paenibacillus radicis (ex Gao et al. 2016)]